MSKEVVNRLSVIAKATLGVELSREQVLGQSYLAGYWHNLAFWARARTLGVPAEGNTSYMLRRKGDFYVWEERQEVKNPEA